MLRDGKRADPDGQGLLADDAAERPRHQRTDLRRNSPANGNTSSARWSGGDSTAPSSWITSRHDPGHRRAGQATIRHRPGDFAPGRRLARSAAAGEGELQEVRSARAATGRAWKIVAGRQFEIGGDRGLLSVGRVGRCWASATRWAGLFNAEIRLNDDKQPEFDFGQPRRTMRPKPVDFSPRSRWAPARNARHGFEHGLSLRLRKGCRAGKTCDFRSGKIILQRPIEREQMHKLLRRPAGPDSIARLRMSSRTKRKFSAFLVRGEKMEPAGCRRVREEGAKKARRQRPATRKKAPAEKGCVRHKKCPPFWRAFPSRALRRLDGGDDVAGIRPCRRPRCRGTSASSKGRVHSRWASRRTRLSTCSGDQRHGDQRQAPAGSPFSGRTNFRIMVAIAAGDGGGSPQLRRQQPAHHRVRSQRKYACSGPSMKGAPGGGGVKCQRNRESSTSSPASPHLEEGIRGAFRRMPTRLRASTPAARPGP